jgi:DNA-binding CsgD family transcriptional regulator
LLSELAERRPVLCLIDDAHWLDTASAEALLFVARRLDAEGIVMLFSAREGEVRTFDARDVASLMVEGLDADSSAVLLARTTGTAVSAIVVERLLEQTKGNALALLEVPSALTPQQLAGSEPLPGALPLTTQVESIFLERVRRLPEETQRLLLVAAADDSEDLGLILRAAKAHGAAPEALDAAERARLVATHGSRLVFRHPLVRSAIYDAATVAERRAAHRALAACLEDGDDHLDRRAWHLASSVVDHDEGVAQAVEDVAERAEARAGYASAATAFERAAGLSSDRTARVRRLVAAARAASISCADDRAVALARRAAPLAETPKQRAGIGYVLGLAEVRRGRPSDAGPIFIEAAREIVEQDPALALELLVQAMGASSQASDTAGEREATSLAATIIPPENDRRARFLRTFLCGFAADVDDERERAAALLAESLEWVADTKDTYTIYLAGVCALYLGDDRRYDALLTRALGQARTRGEIGLVAEALALRAPQLLLAQQFDEAARAAEEAVQFARELKADNFALMPLAVLAALAALRGDDEEARRRAEEAIEHASVRNLRVRVGLANMALGLLDLGRGRWAEALERFDVAASVNTVGAIRVAPDRIEAAVRANRLSAARAVLDQLESWVASARPGWAQPVLARSRALLTSGDEATAHFEEAMRLAEHARPFDLARTHLLYGEHLRRERRRADARVHLRTALEAFERFRAAPWVERAAAELRATGETARKRDPSTFDQLTPQELQISRLVAEGLSNKEVAAQLFLSPRTIDYHLRNVFAKLGITSRTQLARVPLGDEAALAPASA